MCRQLMEKTSDKTEWGNSITQSFLACLKLNMVKNISSILD